ncbi:pectinesterase 2-like [Rutidosis leptorrhynchoides]|uniref:pectinesterase 2-like n=1 Tax=Rutidosis leptorrhynchoides TaxID=125765 RepID=UPI003A99DE94
MKLAHFTYFISFIISCSSQTTTTTAATGNLTWWCTHTPHYQTCNHYVTNGNVSSDNISTYNFLDITVQAAINEALFILKQAQDIESKYPNVPGKSLWLSCLDYFHGIVFTLNMVIDHTLKPTPLNVQTWISAGLTYITTCEYGFELINMTNTMLPTLTTNLTKLLLNSLAISVIIRGGNTPSVVNGNFNNENMISFMELDKMPDVVVAQDGSGDFKTIQEAVDSAITRQRSSSNRYVIHLKTGIYKEYIFIPLTMQYIKMVGDGINKTIITGNRHAGGDMIKTPLAGDLKESATFQVWGHGFIARDITFRNTAGPEGHQAIALLSGSDQSAFYRCSFEGYQDTLYTIAYHQFYKECQIAKSLSGKPLPEGGLVVTAHGRKYRDQPTGFSLQGCKITTDYELKSVIGQYNKIFLGRPWKPYAVTVLMQSFLDDFVDPKGWLDNRGYHETAFYGEFDNYGPGSCTDQRVKWRGYHVIDDPEIAEYFTVSKLISGNQWLPKTGLPYIPGLENKI